MPKLNNCLKSKSKEVNSSPYNIDIIKQSLVSWKRQAKDYERAAFTNYKDIKTYVNNHKKDLASKDAEDIYNLLSKWCKLRLQ